MESIPKYSKLEIERKWLIKPEKLPVLSALEKQEITDTYFPETRVRLRKMYNPQSKGSVYKLCKKYGKQSNDSEPITNVYLDETEYLFLSNLPGYTLTKNRYEYFFQGKQFFIDECIRTKGNLYILELELEDGEKFENVNLPECIERDVTDEASFNGYFLARAISQA